MIGLNTNPRSKTEIITSFKDEEGNEMIITGKDAYLSSFEFTQPSQDFQQIYSGKEKIRMPMCPEPITIKLEFLLPPTDKDGNANYIVESFMDGFKPKRKISKLRVEDCSINELLFAVREKVKNE